MLFSFFIYLFIILANANFTGKKRSVNHTTYFFDRNIFIAMKLKMGYLIIKVSVNSENKRLQMLVNFFFQMQNKFSKLDGYIKQKISNLIFC